ncbi:hypothetical protein, partial [Escherichia coli]
RFDPAAQALGAIAVGCVVFATIDARHDALRAVLLIATGAAAIALFVRIERRLGTAALVPLDLFANRAFRGML